VQQKSPANAKRLIPFWLKPLAVAVAAVRRQIGAPVPPVGFPRSETSASKAQRALPYAFGLQGGGALGAFTWGVLDRLLDEPDFDIEALSGASAGAANAVVLASGWMRGGRSGAQQALESFWRRVGHLPSALRSSPSGFWFDPVVAFEMMSSVVSPYQFNPLDHNPLRAILGELVDFKLLQSAKAPRIFVSATDVETGRARIFANDELRLEAVLASTCLPTLFQAVEIDGRHYWDGGFSANPPVDPLRAFQEHANVLLVLVNPTAHQGVPRDARVIASRLNQIIGNAGLLRDIERLGDHQVIELENAGPDYTTAAKYDNDWRAISRLRDRGRQQAEAWLTQGAKIATAA
jgi:NTE family protein